MMHFASRGHLAALIVFLVTLTGCADADRDGVGAVHSAVVGGESESVPLGRAHVRVYSGGLDCSGTLIAPDWVLTAAHCLGNYSGSATIYAYPEGSSAVSVSANSCHVHPEAVAAACDPTGGALTCEDYAAAQRRCDTRTDVALLHLEAPVEDVPFRTIAPPRLCDVDAGPDWEFPFVFRGYGGGSIATPVVRGAWVGIEDTPNLLNPSFAPGQGVIPGDSGGGYTCGLDDEHGPVVEVVANDVGHGTRLWTGFGLRPTSGPVEWIWSVVDPAGHCAAGSTDPCVWREESESDAVCGDAHCTGAEDAASCPADCRPALADSDADGLPDIRDLCPWVALPAGAAQHADADFDHIGDECDRPGCDSPCVTDDADHDRVFGTCDNCPDVPNPDQADCDGDGVGDACEPFVDLDEDGVDDTCVGGDNCPVSNPDQANCNADAERWEMAPALGDACDPVPCGETVLENSWRGSTLFEGVTRDQVRIDARSQVIQDARTGLRFCPCNAATEEDSSDERNRCRTVAGCSHEPATYVLEELEVGWRRATTDWNDSPPPAPDGEVIATYAPPTLGDVGETVFETDLSATWQLRSVDEPRWQTAYGEPTGRDRPGVLWTRTPRTAGGKPLAIPNPALASHFWSGVVSDRITVHMFPRFLTLPPFPRACWACQGFFPRAFLALDSATRTPHLASALGAIDAQALAEPGVSFERAEWEAWVAPSESGAALAGTAVRLVAIDRSKGFTGGDVLVERAGRFALRLVPGTSGSATLSAMSLGAAARMSGTEETEEPLADELEPIVIRDSLPDPRPLSRTFEASAERFAPLAAPVESAPIAALSARRERLWAFVGNVLQIVDLATGWTKWVDYPGQPLAATYSSAHDAVYVVDVYGKVARLVRLEIDGTVGTVIGKWSRDGKTTRFALAASPGGSLWLLGSDEDSERVVAWIDAGALPVAAHAVRADRGAIVAGAALADEMGLSFVAVGSDGAPEAAGYRAEELQPTQLGIDACF